MLLDRSTVDDLRLLVLFVGVDVFLVDFSGLSDSSVVGVKVGGGGSKGVVVSGSVPDLRASGGEEEGRRSASTRGRDEERDVAGWRERRGRKGRTLM